MVIPQTLEFNLATNTINMRLLLVFISFIIQLSFTSGQSLDSLQTEIDSIAELSAESFSEVTKFYIAKREILEKPLFIGECLLLRFSKDKHTGYDDIIMIVKSYIDYDYDYKKSSLNSSLSTKGFISLSYMEKILLRIYKQPFLKTKISTLYYSVVAEIWGGAQLDLNQSFFSVKDRNELKVHNELLEIINLSDSLRSETIRSYLYHCNKAAKIYFYKRQLKKAEKYYLKVLLCPFEYEPNKFLQKQMYDQYLIAGKGLLFCRRDNLKSLERTFFHKTVKAKLEPLRQELITIQRNKN